jgi:hypothetical protein
VQAPGLTAKFVQANPDRRAIEPAFRILALRLRTPRQFEEHFDGEFLRTRMVANYSRDNARNAFILSAENSFEVEIVLALPNVSRYFRRHCFA